jgi:CheY-like chemotaxis protein
MPRPHIGTILVVDDQEGVRILIRRQLGEYGHTVLEASDGAEALHLLRRRNGKVGLVLSDVVMPGMNGTELAAVICNEFPGVPVVLMSAYAPAGLTRVGFQGAIVPVLRKPFEESQLKELVEVALEMPGRATRSVRPTTAV